MHQSGRLGEAEALYMKLLDKGEQTTGCLTNLSIICFQTKQFQTSPSPLRKHDGVDVYGVLVVLVVDEDKEEEKVVNAASEDY